MYILLTLRILSGTETVVGECIRSGRFKNGEIYLSCVNVAFYLHTLKVLVHIKALIDLDKVLKCI